MRDWQPIGLKIDAQIFLEKNSKKKKEKCPICGEGTIETPICKIYNTKEIWYGAGPKLKIYELEDGTKVRTVIQECIWDSGPMTFECIEKEDGQECLNILTKS